MIWFTKNQNDQVLVRTIIVLNHKKTGSALVRAIASDKLIFCKFSAHFLM